MKKYIALVIIVLGISISAMAKKSAQITFATKQHDFGIVKEANGSVAYNFQFKNTGDAPLVILETQASCGCTTPSYPKEPIAVGATAVINVKFNPKGRPGGFRKSIKVMTNARNKRVNLEILGSVVPK